MEKISLLDNTLASQFWQKKIKEEAKEHYQIPDLYQALRRKISDGEAQVIYHQGRSLEKYLFSLRKKRWKIEGLIPKENQNLFRIIKKEELSPGYYLLQSQRETTVARSHYGLLLEALLLDKYASLFREKAEFRQKSYGAGTPSGFLEINKIDLKEKKLSFCFSEQKPRIILSY